ncbi:hypothetical protein BSLG_008008 [Batrachochytrium salamandrivorans]|nr:hypothetical protein BSLG_008008 [Batrachochytrium salamandrivorans]
MSITQHNLVALSPHVQQLYQTLVEFVEYECIPAEKLYEQQHGQGAYRWKIIPKVIETLKSKAQKLGLWNLFLPKTYPESPGLSNLEYAVLCEVLGRSLLAAEATNTSAPDTGNMEVLAKYGTEAQKAKWLVPLMHGQIRSAFAMTEPAVASSDATNIETRIIRDGDSVSGHGKSGIQGAGKHHQQSVVIVPADAPGVRIIRPMLVYGYDDAPHGHVEMVFENVRIPVDNMILGEGRGFEIIQGRLGPGRIHHCMRAIGTAERALDLHILRLTDPKRKTFGKILAQHGTASDAVAQSRVEIDQARLLVLRAADLIDKAYGAQGVSQDTPLAAMYAFMRTLRIADGPDEVHAMQIAKTELRRADAVRAKTQKQQELAHALAKL